MKPTLLLLPCCLDSRGETQSAVFRQEALVVRASLSQGEAFELRPGGLEGEEEPATRGTLRLWEEHPQRPFLGRERQNRSQE